MKECYTEDDRMVEIPEYIKNMSKEERKKLIAILEEAGRKEGENLPDPVLSAGKESYWRGEKHSRTYFADNLDWKYQLNKTDWGRGFLGLFLLFKKFCGILMGWNINPIQELLSECAWNPYKAIFTN